jgi:hypothetical protein
MTKVCLICAMLRRKGCYIIIFNQRSFCAKWVDMEGKVQKHKGCFAKDGNLLLNRKDMKNYTWIYV